jgi:thioredoxin-dependent peroxiredoxin
VRHLLLGVSIFFSALIVQAKIETGSIAPEFEIKTHDGAAFRLADRKNRWTVLYFYPKADTPGCTKQACAFRDSIDLVRKQNADVFGISVNTVEEQKAFHKKYHLNFTLLADADAKIATKYGAKRPDAELAQRWTYIIDPDLRIRSIEKDVDPVMDAQATALKLKELQKSYTK